MLKKLRMQQALILIVLTFTGYSLVKLLCPDHRHCYGQNLWHADFKGSRFLIDAGQSDIIVFGHEPNYMSKLFYKRHSENLDGRHTFTFSKQKLLGNTSDNRGIKGSLLSVRFVDLYNQNGNCLITLKLNDKLHVLELNRVN
ncbi:hypothetical protein [Vibrio sp.]|uniref:hypothetical protein n=1 Tax=Vibrio sp. TaxID=678 RepID=UPI0031202C53